jgi:hypothetical protein
MRLSTKVSMMHDELRASSRPVAKKKKKKTSFTFTFAFCNNAIARRLEHGTKLEH